MKNFIKICAIFLVTISGVHAAYGTEDLKKELAVAAAKSRNFDDAHIKKIENLLKRFSSIQAKKEAIIETLFKVETC